MSEEEKSAAEAQSAQKESKVSMMMIILLVILIWAVVAYFMTMDPGIQGEGQQQETTAEQPVVEPQAVPQKREAAAVGSVEESQQMEPSAVETTENAAATAVVEAEQVPAKDEKEAVDALMDLFAPSGK